MSLLERASAVLRLAAALVSTGAPGPNGSIPGSMPSKALGGPRPASTLPALRASCARSQCVASGRLQDAGGSEDRFGGVTVTVTVGDTPLALASPPGTRTRKVFVPGVPSVVSSMYVELAVRTPVLAM